jgi:hypothetical protein
MTRIALVMALATALAGCISDPASRSGIVAVSPGVFAMSIQSVPRFYKMGMLRAWALTNAVEHCKSLKKTMRIVDEKPAEPPPGSSNNRRFDLTFACD